MAHNSHGSYRTTREAVMRAYDKLPPEVRHALQNANHDWVSQPLLSMLHREWKPATLVNLIKTWDRKKHKRDVKRGKVAP
jgi:uncharacterized protein DUF6525